MEIFPAIDLRGGQAVRLFQGDYDQMTVYSSDPLAVARGFAQAGTKNLHVVDLDGARQGEPVNLEVIGRLIRESGLQVQVGGGIRTEERIRTYLELGAARVILGTVAVENFDFTARMAAAYPGRIAVGIDMKDGMAATRGWEQVSSQSGLELCEKFLAAGVDTVICTDISRDGAEQGTNLDLYRELSELGGLDITASGGLSSLEELRELQKIGTKAAILGKALYTGRLDLKAVIREVGAC